MLNTTLTTEQLDQRYRTTRFVTVAGAVVNLLLSFLKVFIGYIGQSHALVVDGIHSLSDLLSDVMVVYAAKHGNQSADEDHPYGHARIETAFAAIFGGILIAVGVGIVIDALERLTTGDIVVPEGMTLWVALLSVISKEALYWYTLHYANKIKSKILKANAWHHRSDAVSSIVVLIGITGSIAGVPYLDSAAAVMVSMMIAKIGWDIAKESIDQLVDKGLDADKVAEISKHINEIPGVIEIHSFRSRHMGSETLLDVHVEVDPQLSVSEGHRISDEVSKELTSGFSDVSQVLVHIDPENDEKNSRCSHLPLREGIIQQLNRVWENIELHNRIERITLHYLNGKVSVEIILPLAELQVVEEYVVLSDQFKKDAASLDFIRNIEVFYR